MFSKIKMSKAITSSIQEHIESAFAYHQTGRLNEAQAIYQDILAVDPNHITALHYFGLASYQQGDDETGIKLIKKALQLCPSYAEAYNNLGEIYRKQGQFDIAIACYQKASTIKPDYAVAINNQGLAFDSKANFDEAITCYQKALQIKADFPEAYNNLGLAFANKLDFERAMSFYQKALQLRPMFGAVYNNLGAAYESMNQLDEAIAHYQKSLQIIPNNASVSFNMALAKLKTGQFAEGWKLYENRIEALRLNPRKVFSMATQWQGDKLNKTLLVNCEQGFGDSIQFVRYLPLLKLNNPEAKIIFRCQSALINLFASNLTGIELIDKNNKVPDYDQHIFLLSLPNLFDTLLETIPAQIPYLKSFVTQSTPILTPFDGLKIGFVWAGNRQFKNDSNRSTAFENFSMLFELQNTHFYSLQVGEGELSASHLQKYQNLTDCQNLITDFADTVAIIEQLDLVISVDSAVAHLAGALGKPVWILLPFAPDWRWLLNREDSPWYPTARLFRQTSTGDWEGVFRRVKQAIIEQTNHGASEEKDVEVLTHLALTHHQAGRLIEAKDLYKQIIALEPNHITALHYFGLVCHQQGDDETGIKLIEKALQLSPNYDEAYNNLGEVYRTQGKSDIAINLYQKALQIKPDYLEARYNLGVAFQNQKRFEDAVICYQIYLQNKPNDAKAHNNLGLVFDKLKQFKAAIECYQKVLQLQPDFAEAYNNLGIVYFKNGNIDDAMACYRNALTINPNYAEAHNNLGVAFSKQAHFDEAILHFEQSLAIKPDDADTCNNLGSAWGNKNCLDEAVVCYKKSLQINPNNAQVGFNLSLVLLKQGFYEEGFKYYENRLHLESRKEMLQTLLPEKLWRGESIDGKTLLVICEQGLGDSIQFVRYLPLLSAGHPNATIILVGDKSLKSLFESSLTAIYLMSDDAVLPHYDSYVFLLSLPLFLKTRADTIPASIPYLKSAIDKAVNIHIKSECLNVAIVWSGSKVHKNNKNRSISLQKFSELFAVDNTHFYSLQIGEDALTIRDLETYQNLTDCQSLITDFADTAAIIEQLDLVISVDSAVAHLAGALGKPVWILLPFAPDWRWLLTHEDSPWYLTARLFRQKTIGDWDGVFERVKAALFDQAKPFKNAQSASSSGA